MSLQQSLPLSGVTPDRTGKYRSDHLLVAEMVDRGSKVLDVGCGDGECCSFWKAAASMAAASNCRARRQPLRRQGARVVQATLTPISSTILMMPSIT